MNPEKFLDEYIRITDVMYQALKAYKYEIFEKALDDRGKLLNEISSIEDYFDALPNDMKKDYKGKMKDFDQRIEAALGAYKIKLQDELASVHSSKAKLRKQSVYFWIRKREKR